LQQQQPKLANEDSEDREDIKIRQVHNKFAEMQAASKRLERKLPKLEQRFQENGMNIQEVWK
jgi:hypothetical protein